MEGHWFNYRPEQDFQADREYLVPYTKYIIIRREVPRYLTPQARIIMNMFLQYVTKNILPYEGGYWDQPAPIADIITCLTDQLEMRKKKT